MTFGYPIVLDLAGVPVLVVGGGRVAARKVQGLAEAGAEVTVVAPRVAADIDGMAAHVERRRYASGEAAGYRLVITATDDPEVNAAVAADARAGGVWVNSADDPANCSFILPAVTRRGPVLAAVSSGGASPALASHLRDEIAAKVLLPGVEVAAADLAAQRAAIHAAGRSTESVHWAARVWTALTVALSRP